MRDIDTDTVRTSACADDNIAQRVLEALWSHPAIMPSDIEIMVRGRALTLTGRVTSTAELDAIEDVLDALTCAGRIDNRIELPAPRIFAKAA